MASPASALTGVLRPRSGRGGRIDPSAALGYAALVAAALAGGVLFTLIAYLTSPLIAFALPFAVALGVLVVRRPMTGVYLALLCVPLERLGFAAGGSDVTPAKALLLLTGFAAIGHLALAPGARRVDPAHAAFAGLLLVMALGLTKAVEPFVTLKILVQWTAYLAISIYLANAEREQLMRALACLAVAGGILGAVAVLTAQPQTVSAGGQAATGRAEGSFQHPAILAFFLVMALPAAIALAFRWKAWARPLMIAAAALCLAGIVLSLTRGAILAAAVSMLILLFWPPFRRLAGVLIVGLLLFTAFNWQSIEQSQQFQVIGSRLRTITETRASADNERVLIWGKTPAIIADNPFIGVATGNFPEISPSYGIVEFGGAPFVHAHNIFLTIAAENGLFGLLFFLAFLGALARAALAVLGRGRGSPDFPFALAMAAGLAGLFFNALTDGPQSVLVIWAVVMIEVGAFVGFARRATDPATAEPEPA
jgi:putative inorganic carbon (hco3(-)) transporter